MVQRLGIELFFHLGLEKALNFFVPKPQEDEVPTILVSRV